MWTELRNCCEGDYIKAYFLGDTDVPNGGVWHKIYTLYRKTNGKYYAAIEGWKGDEVFGVEDVYIKD